MERDIDYVIAVAECGSISQAAEMLYISQPSLSRYISSLEHDLGVGLFVRTINGTELTEAGKIYLKYAKEIKLLRGTMEHELRKFKQANMNRIRIGMTLNAASLSIFNVAEKVKQRYPGCRVELFNIMSKDIEESLKEKKYNFVIGPDVEKNPDFGYERFSSDPFVLIVPERYDISRYVEHRVDSCFPYINMGILPSMDFVLQEESTSVRKGIERLVQHTKYKITPKLLVTSSPLAVQAAESGLGCCVVNVGHLAYVNHAERLNFYQIEEEITASSGVVFLRTKSFSQEEKYCVACIRNALLAGEKEILKYLKKVGKMGI